MHQIDTKSGGCDAIDEAAMSDTKLLESQEQIDRCRQHQGTIDIRKIEQFPFKIPQVDKSTKSIHKDDRQVQAKSFPHGMVDIHFLTIKPNVCADPIQKNEIHQA